MDQARKKRREDALRKIRALTAMTVDQGATEAEAMTASAMVARLMAEWDVADDELDVRESPVGGQGMDYDSVLGEHFFAVCKAVASLCGVKTWNEIDRSHRSVGRTFYGLHRDVEVAVYLGLFGFTCGILLLDSLPESVRLT